jgi:hypothetical protein
MEKIQNINVDPSQNEWKGYTLDELRYRRALSLVKREIGRNQLMNSVNDVKTRVSDNGIRGLMANNSLMKKMKLTDYVLLGFKLSNVFYKLWRRNKR